MVLLPANAGARLGAPIVSAIFQTVTTGNCVRRNHAIGRPAQDPHWRATLHPPLHWTRLGVAHFVQAPPEAELRIILYQIRAGANLKGDGVRRIEFAFNIKP